MPKRTRSYREWQLEKLSDPEIAAGFLNASREESVEVFVSALGKVNEAKQQTFGQRPLAIPKPHRE